MGMALEGSWEETSLSSKKPSKVQDSPLLRVIVSF